MRITILLLVFFLSAIFYLGSCNSAFAKEATSSGYVNDIGYSRIHPAHPLYFLKGVRENLEMHFAQTPRVKFIRQLEFATRRLREVNSLILKNRQDLIEPNLLRYWVYVSTLIDKNSKNKDVMQEITDNLRVHTENLEKIYFQLTNLRAKMAVRSTLNKIIEKVDLPIPVKITVCNLFTREATASALNEAEREVYKERAQKCM